MWDRLWDLDWNNAQTLYALLIVPVIGAVFRWLRAKSSLEEQYRDQRAMTTAGIASYQIYPRLAKLIAELPSPVGIVKRTWRPGDESEIEDHLQAIHISRMVNEMTPHFADSAACRRHQQEIENWLKWQAWGLLAYLPGALFISWAVLQQSFNIPSEAYWVAVCDCLVGASVAAVFFGLELTCRNRLATLSMRHGTDQP